MSERTVAVVSPNVTNGVVVNVEVVAPDWTNLIEYTPEQPAAIGWAVIDGVVQVPPPPPEPEPGNE